MADNFYPYYKYPSWIEEKWEKMYDLSTSYRRGASVLLGAEAWARDNYSERDIFPCMFVIHNYLELMMKAFICQRTGDLVTGHDLEKLRNELKVQHPHLDFKYGEKLIQFMHEENGPMATRFKYNFNCNGEEDFTDKPEEADKGVSFSFVYMNVNEIFDIAEGYFKKLKNE